MLLLAWFAMLALAAPPDAGVPVENEVQRLELKSAHETLDLDSRKKLAELYFLTSRCQELKDLLFLYPKLQPDIVAACTDSPSALKGEHAETLPGRALRLRALVESGKTEKDVEVENLLQKLGQRPEAKAALLKGMRARLASGWIPDRASAARMRALETLIGSMEVK